MFWFTKPQPKQRVMLKHEWCDGRLEFTLAHAQMLGAIITSTGFGGTFDECRDMIRLNADGFHEHPELQVGADRPSAGFSAAV